MSEAIRYIDPSNRQPPRLSDERDILATYSPADVTFLTKGLQVLILINVIEWDDGEAWR